MKATAENTKIEVQKITMSLEMTFEEARALREICSLISGDYSGPRGVIAKIGDALSNVNIRWRGRDVHKIEGHICCPSTFQ